MKTTLRRSLNLALYLTFCAMVGTGLLLEFRLPPGREGGHGWTAYGLDRHDWGEWHLLLGYIFIGLIVAHMVLAWPWLKKVAAKGRLWPVFGGLVVGLVLIAFPFFMPVKRPGDGVADEHFEHRDHANDRQPALGRGREGDGRGRGYGRGRPGS